MKYSDLIEFEPIESGVQLLQADTAEEAKRLVRSFVVSDDMADGLTGLVFPHLRFDPPGDAKGLFIVGGPGSGKSHLMSVVSAVAQHADLAEELAHPAVARGALRIAGKFKVIRVEVRSRLGKRIVDLRDFVWAQLQKGLDNWGINYRLPGPGRLPHTITALGELMVEFHRAFPNHGLLLLVDDLSGYLRSRHGRALTRDLAFLSDLSDACVGLRFRVIAGLEQMLPDAGVSASVASSIRRVRDGFQQVPILQEAVCYVVAKRLLRKTAEQRAKIREHLTSFARFYGTMNERMEEFVALFPIHPDCIEVFGRITLAEKPGVLRTLSDAVKKVLHTPIPRDRPGVVAFDSYWDELRSHPAFRLAPEIEAVSAYSKRVEGSLARAFPQPGLKDMAQRLVHALSVHRLTTSDIYSRHGATPDELRDMLCLHLPGVEELGGDPADDLLLYVVAVLDVLQKTGRGRLLSYDPDTNQYYLHLRTFKRFIKPEVVLHWVNGGPFLALMATGGALLVSRLCHIEGAMLSGVVMVHKVCAAAWAILVPLTVLMRPRAHWQHIRPMLKWGTEDVVWMVQSARGLLDKQAAVPPAARFNTGQKINACLVMLYFVGFIATGSMMLWKGSILFPWYIHTTLFLAAVGSVGGHLYLALVNPSTRIALAGIFHGWAPMKYVEHHHPLSLPPSLQSHATGVSAASLWEELLAYKKRVTLLAVGFVVAGAIVVGFNRSALASMNAFLTRSLSAGIQPSVLSSKHRLGTAGQSCTRCHSYAGTIPNDKCEACHGDIKQRRASVTGYHGTLKGDCIVCHKEHPTSAKKVVPLVREKFDHNLASFKRDGKHAKVACDECHKTKRTPDTPGIYYIGLPHDSCTDCHRDPHARQLTASCDTCHSAKGWKGNAVTFVHDVNSSFALAGKHKALDCSKCHKPATPGGPLSSSAFKGLPANCAGCHEDPHRRQFVADCSACHSPAGWRGEHLRFDHNRDSTFSLVGKHAETACQKCHSPPGPGKRLGFAQFRGLKAECADCHKDPHRGQFQTACTKCHAAPFTWAVSKRQFDHDKDTRYPLSGKHTSVDCVKCHKPRPVGGSLGSATFKGLATGCDTCHKVDHPPQYGPTCTSCHTFASWPRKNPGFAHIYKQEIAGEHLSGKHLSAKCSACHNGTRIGPLEQPHSSRYDCARCHRLDDPHQESLGPSCSRCHSMEGWKGEELRFNHDTMASYALDQSHRKVACTKCHQDGRWKPLSAACDSCHPKFFQGNKK